MRYQNNHSTQDIKEHSNLKGKIKAMETVQELNVALDDICYKYERLTSLIGIMWQFTADCVEINGTTENAVTNSLYEIELEFRDNNKKLRDFISQISKRQIKK